MSVPYSIERGIKQRCDSSVCPSVYTIRRWLYCTISARSTAIGGRTSFRRATPCFVMIYQQSCAAAAQPSLGHVTDRKWSSCGSDGEPAEDDDDDDVEDVATTSDSFHVASTTAAVTSLVTSDGDVRRRRTTADGCEDERAGGGGGGGGGGGAGALDLIRHAVHQPASTSSLRHCTSSRTLDDVTESAHDVDVDVDRRRRLSVGAGRLCRTHTDSAPPS